MKYWYRKNLSEDHSDAPREFPELRERFARLGINPNDYQVQTAEGKTTWAPAEDQWIPMRVAIRYDPLAKVPLESLRAIGHYQSTRSHVNAFAFILPLLLWPCSLISILDIASISAAAIAAALAITLFLNFAVVSLRHMANTLMDLADLRLFEREKARCETPDRSGDP